LIPVTSISFGYELDDRAGAAGAAAAARRD
jgi:hypothetical protein